MCGRCCCVRGSVSGSVVNVIIARYLLVYKHTSPPPGAGRTPSPGSTLAALLADNKVLLFHAAYILMLALIGNLATSTSFASSGFPHHVLRVDIAVSII